MQCWCWTHVMKFNDDYFVESAGEKEEESMQSEVMLGNLHNFCIFFQIGPNAQYKDVSTTKCHYRHNSPPGPDGGEHLLHHLAEVRGGQRLDCVDGAVGRVVVVHLVLGERHLGVLFIVGSDPVDGQLYLRSKGERR